MIAQWPDELLDTADFGMIEGQQVQLCLQFRPGRLQNDSTLAAVYELDALLREIIEATDTGVYDGFDFFETPDEESVSYFIYGPDANLLYEAIAPILPYLPKLPGSFLSRRYGNYGAKEERMPL